MNKNILPIISAKELKEILGKSDLIIIDSSYPNGKSIYTKEHIEGALFVDLDTDLADIKLDFALGGRHPLPSVTDFIEVLNRLGISNESHVVIYDHNSGAFASRMWWMLRSIGHKNVQVLDGGFSAAVDAGIMIQHGINTPQKRSNYQADQWNWNIQSMREVETALKSTAQMVIDVRGEARYKGKTEPIDLIAGHIPGAINIPFMDNLDSEGKYKSAEELKEQYTSLLGNTRSKNVIFHCGSGVTACHSILALEIAGFETPALYVGSWSEWSRNNKPMVTNE